MKSRFIAIGVVACVSLAGIAAATATAGPQRSSGDQLVGAGSTFVAPLVSKWQADYPSKTGVQIVYSGIGSGGGIAAITNRTVDFGTTDAPLSPDQFTACKGCFQLPWALGGIAVMFNLHTNAHAPLRISGPLLAQIYQGQITNWNDSAIQKLNPGVSLPNQKITPVYRSDASGSSYAFTDFLSSVSPGFKSAVGFSTQPAFKTGVGAKGSSGVAGVVKNTTGAIGYADIAFAITNKITTMAVKNAAGKFTTPGEVSISAAAAAFPKVGPNNEMHITNPPKSAPTAYPISTYSYVVVPQVTSKAALLKKFIFYAATIGQKLGVPLRYVPIPKAVLVATEKTLNQVHS
jgi:phosphate transport system substrate-binding protein